MGKRVRRRCTSKTQKRKIRVQQQSGKLEKNDHPPLQPSRKRGENPLERGKGKKKKSEKEGPREKGSKKLKPHCYKKKERGSNRRR